MKRPAGKPGPQSPARKDTNKGAATPGETTCQPLRRRPRLFAVLLVSFLIWLGALLTLYFRTVYPMRYPASAPGTTSKS